MPLKQLFGDVVMRRLLLIAVVVHLLAVWFSLGHYHADEHYQILEFAGVKLGLVQAEQLVWEYPSQIRSGFQPFIVWMVAKLSIFLGIHSPYTWTFILRLLSALVSLVAVVVFFQSCRHDLRGKNCQRWALAAMLLLWPLVFYNVRFSSEGWMSSFLLMGMAFLRSLDDPAFPGYKRFLVGFLFGIAFLCRFQGMIMILSLGAWSVFIQRETTTNIALMILGGVVAVLLGVLMDKWLYGEWVWSAWEYLQWHLANDTAQGGSWWDAYIKNTVLMLPPMSVMAVFILLGFWFHFPRHPITWAIVLYVLFHCWIDNRQLRFLFPVLPFLPLMAAMLWEKVTGTSKNLNGMGGWGKGT